MVFQLTFFHLTFLLHSLDTISSRSGEGGRADMIDVEDVLSEI